MNKQSDTEQICPVSLLGWLWGVHPFFLLLVFAPVDLGVQLETLLVLQSVFLPLAQSVVRIHRITCNCRVVLDIKL